MNSEFWARTNARGVELWRCECHQIFGVRDYGRVHLWAGGSAPRILLGVFSKRPRTLSIATAVDFDLRSW